MNNKNQVIILTAFILFVIAFHLFGYIGHYGYDDIQYAKLASDFNNGILHLDDHFSYRTPIIIFTSVSYSLFGISDFASSLPSMLISILILILIYIILKNRGYITLVTGLSLTAFSYWFLFYSDKLMPDIYVAFSVLAVMTIIYKYKYSDHKRNPVLYSAFICVALLFGFMSKGTIILILPLLIFFLIVDIFLKRDFKFWIFSLMTGSLVLILYFTVIWIITGDFFKRFDAIISNSYINSCSYDKQSFAILLRRIISDFFKMIVSNGMATGFIFIVAYLFRRNVINIFKFNDQFSFWTVSALILLLSSNFMTISLTSYSPMCLDPRHYLFLIPVVSIPASIIITDFIKRKDLNIQILIVSLIIMVVSFFTQGDMWLTLYLPLTVLVLLYSVVKISRIFQILFLTLFVIILSIKPIDLVIYGQKIKYREQKEVFINHVLERDDKCVVITNDVQKRLALYYNEFDSDGNQQFLNYDEFKYDSTDTRVKILFLNWYTRYLSELDYNDLPYYARNISPENKLIYNDEELDISVYEMTDFSIPDLMGKTLLHTLNDFEKNYNHWNQNINNISKEIQYSGDNSYKVDQYSSTFKYPLDSLQIDKFKYLLIRCNLYCTFSDKTSSKLVVAVENKEGSYIWEGVQVDKYLKAYSGWWPVKYELILDKKEIRDDSWLKVYLWNTDKRLAYIDNFEVKIIGTGD